MVDTTNTKIVEDIRKAGLYQYEIADALNKTESTLIRWLRKPLPDDKRAAVYNAIEQLSREREAV